MATIVKDKEAVLLRLEDRISAMLVFMRIEHGNDSKRQGGSTP